MPLGVLILSLLKRSQVALNTQSGPKGYPLPLLLLPREGRIHHMALSVGWRAHKDSALSDRVGLSFLGVTSGGLGYIERSLAWRKVNEWVLVDGRLVESVPLGVALTDEVWLHPYVVVFARPWLNHHALPAPLLELRLGNG